MSQETPMNRSGEIQVDVLDLYKALTPMIASQRLEGYYTFLSYSRNRGDQRRGDFQGRSLRFPHGIGVD
jgi:hypothetical protein